MSPARKNAVSADARLDRIRDLEGQFYEVEHATGIVWDLLSAVFDGARAEGVTPAARPDLYSCDPGQVERLHYAASQAWQKAEKLRADLLAGLGYGA